MNETKRRCNEAVASSGERLKSQELDHCWKKQTASKTRARQTKPVVICSSRNIRIPPWKDEPAVLTRIRAWKCLGKEKGEEDGAVYLCRSLARCRRKGERKGWVRTVRIAGRELFLVKHSWFPPVPPSPSPYSLHLAFLLSSVSRAECSGSWSQLKRVDMLPLPRWFEERLRRGDERGIHGCGDEKGGRGRARQGEMGKEKDAPR